MFECLQACVGDGGLWSMGLAVLYGIFNIVVATSKTGEGSGKWNTAKKVLDFLSVLTHKDAEGTLKAPIVRKSKKQPLFPPEAASNG